MCQHFLPIISSYFNVSEGRNVLAAFKSRPACEILSLFTRVVGLSFKLPVKTRSCDSDSLIGQILPSLDAKRHTEYVSILQICFFFYNT